MRSPIAVILLLTVVMYSDATHSRPALDLIGAKHDFGAIPQNTTIINSVWFRSAGDDTLRILDVKTGCKCFIMPLERDWLAPGDSMLVTFTWDTERRMGRIGRFPVIYTNARPEPYHIQMEATAVTSFDSLMPVIARPHTALMARFPQKSIDTLSISLSNRAQKPVNLRVLTLIPEQVELVVPETIDGEATGTLQVRVKPEYLDAEFEAVVTLLVEGDYESRFTIPIIRKVYAGNRK